MRKDMCHNNLNVLQIHEEFKRYKEICKVISTYYSECKAESATRARGL